MGACGPAKLDDSLVCCSGWDVALRNNDPGLALWDHSGTAAFSILHPHLSLTCSGCKLFVAGTGDTSVCCLAHNPRSPVKPLQCKQCIMIDGRGLHLLSAFLK